MATMMTMITMLIRKCFTLFGRWRTQNSLSKGITLHSLIKLLKREKLALNQDVWPTVGGGWRLDHLSHWGTKETQVQACIVPIPFWRTVHLSCSFRYLDAVERSDNLRAEQFEHSRICRQSRAKWQIFTQPAVQTNMKWIPDSSEPSALTVVQ